MHEQEHEQPQQLQHRQVLEAAEQFARAELGGDTSGHDWWHVHRVARMAERLAKQEGASVFLCVLAALLHDVADEKLNPSKEAGLLKVSSWLEGQSLAETDAAHVMEIISTMSYNGGQNPPMRTIEGQVVQDADRLDAIGAIAIARCFTYAGWKGDAMYDPTLPPRDTMTSKEYREGRSTAINHFYEKLLKLKNRINTPSAKQIAEARHQYMEAYLRQFMQEWEGSDSREQLPVDGLKSKAVGLPTAKPLTREFWVRSVKTQSKLGIASFVMGLISLISFFGGLIYIVVSMSGLYFDDESGYDEYMGVNMEPGGLLFIPFILIIVAVVLSFIGLILGIIGTCASNKRKLYALFGSALNLITAILFVITLLSN